jgi:hypothetical protein
MSDVKWPHEFIPCLISRHRKVRYLTQVTTLRSDELDMDFSSLALGPLLLRAISLSSLGLDRYVELCFKMGMPQISQDRGRHDGTMATDTECLQQHHVEKQFHLSLLIMKVQIKLNLSDVSRTKKV